MATADSFHTVMPTIGDAQQRLVSVAEEVAALPSLASVPAAAAATGCPETGAVITQVTEAISRLLSQLSSALSQDNATLDANVRAYHLAETTVETAMHSTMGTLTGATA